MAFDFSSFKKQPAKQQAPQTTTDSQYGEYTNFVVDDVVEDNDPMGGEDFYGDNFTTSSPSTNMRGKAQPASGSAVTKVRIMKPRVYEDARNIASKLNEGYIVSMNLECVESNEEVKNIMTFLAGVVFALRAEIVSVSDQVWLLYPKNLVQLSEEGNDDK